MVGEKATAGIFATYPQPFLSTFGGLVDQVVGTALLLLVIFAIGDAKNLAPEPRSGPLVVGALVVLIGMTFGYNAGYAINPARDFGPRLFTALAGWGSGRLQGGTALVVGARSWARSWAEWSAASSTTRSSPATTRGRADASPSDTGREKTVWGL